MSKHTDMDTEYGRRIAALLIREQQGGLTPGQQQELDRWRACSQARTRLSQRIGDPQYVDVGLRGRAAAANTDATRWEAILHRIAARRQVRRLRLWAAGGAAAAAVAAGAVLLAPRTAQDVPIARQTVQPGSPRAVLCMDDGSRVELDGRGTVDLGAGVTAADGTLEYAAGQAASGTRYHTLIVPRGGIHTLHLADGTVVTLNAGSQLRYPVAFAGGTRGVELQGEAFFEVSADRSKPFVVTASGMQVRVTGTAFNVDAYNPATVRTVLVEGRVSVTEPIGGRQWPLMPSQAAVCDLATGETTITHVDTRQYTAWKEGDFVFRNQPIDAVVESLARWYDVQVAVSDPAIGRMRVTADISRNRELTEVLDAITGSSGIRYKLADGTVTLYE